MQFLLFALFPCFLLVLTYLNCKNIIFCMLLNNSIYSLCFSLFFSKFVIFERGDSLSLLYVIYGRENLFSQDHIWHKRIAEGSKSTSRQWSKFFVKALPTTADSPINCNSQPTEETPHPSWYMIQKRNPQLQLNGVADFFVLFITRCGHASSCRGRACHPSSRWMPYTKHQSAGELR